MKLLISVVLGFGFAIAPLASALAFSPTSPTATQTMGSYVPFSADAPTHPEHDKAAAIRANQRAAVLLGAQMTDAYAPGHHMRSR